MDLETTKRHDQNTPHDLPATAEQAIAAIETIHSDHFPAIAATASPTLGDMNNFVTLADGTSISQPEFLIHYAALADKVATEAQTLIATHPTLAGLKKAQELYRTATVAPPVENNQSGNSTPPHDVFDHDPTVSLEIIDSVIKRRIVEYARNGDGETARNGITEMAFHQAIMTLDHEERKAKTAEKVNAIRPEIERHRNTMQLARQKAKVAAEAGPFVHGIAQNEFEEWFLNVLDAKYQTYGEVPEVVFVNDFDNNVGEHNENDAFKPADSLDRLLTNTLDTVVSTPGRQRVALIHSLQVDPTYGFVIDELYRRAGRAIPLFADVPDTVQAAQQVGIRFIGLTANMRQCGEGVVQRIGFPFEVVGQSHTSVIGPEKPPYLTALLAEDPRRVILHSDDSDSRVVKALARGYAIEGVDFPLAIEDVTFFATRQRGSTELPETPFKLEKALQEAGIPHAINRRVITDAGMVGYQGTKRAVELYQWWQAERLPELKKKHFPNLIFKKPEQTAVAVGDFPIALNEVAEQIEIESAALAVANSEFSLAVDTSIRKANGIELQHVTGGDILQKVIHEYNLPETNAPKGLVNLAQYTYGLRNRVHSLADLLKSQDVRFQTIPVTTLVFSRRIFYGLTGNGDKHDRAGEAGGGEYLADQSTNSFAELREKNVQHVILIDDRSSGSYTSISHVGEIFRGEDFQVIGYAMGHSGGIKYNDNGDLAVAPDGTPICAFEARYETPSQQAYLEQHGLRPDPATELADLGYFRGGGAALMKGYEEAKDSIRTTYAVLNAIITDPTSYNIQVQSLEQIGVIVADKNGLQAFLRQKMAQGQTITSSDIKSLFRRNGHDPIIDIPEVQTFDVDLIGYGRIPELWPGEKSVKSFWDRFTKEEWARASLGILRATASWIETAESTKLGVNIPLTALPMTGIKSIQSLVPPEVINRGSAREFVYHLISTLEYAIEEKPFHSIPSNT